MENLNYFAILAIVISLKVIRKDFQTSWGRQKNWEDKNCKKKHRSPVFDEKFEM